MGMPPTEAQIRSGRRVGKLDHSTHGHAARGRRSRTYTSWAQAKSRCNSPTNAEHANYAGRGITFCERWNNFEHFLADMGERPSGTSLDRIDNDGNYEPGNCRWATPAEQANNQRRRYTLAEIASSAAGVLTAKQLSRLTERLASLDGARERH